MKNLNEAKKLNIGYFEINKIANKVSTESNIRNVFDFEELLENMGATISQEDLQDMKNFITIYAPNRFNITIPKDIDKELKRLLLSQALGHYLLHSQSGKNPIIISSISKSQVSQEGFWFALSLLIPDEEILKLLYSYSDKKILSKFFRVPNFAIEAKCAIMDKIYFKQKEVL